MNISCLFSIGIWMEAKPVELRTSAELQTVDSCTSVKDFLMHHLAILSINLCISLRCLTHMGLIGLNVNTLTTFACIKFPLSSSSKSSCTLLQMPIHFPNCFFYFTMRVQCSFSISPAAWIFPPTTVRQSTWVWVTGPASRRDRTLNLSVLSGCIVCPITLLTSCTTLSLV